MENYTQKIVMALNHPDPKVRTDAAWLLGQKREKAAVQALIAALEENKNDPYLMSIIVESLGFIGEIEALPKLFNLLLFSFLPVRVKSAIALMRIGDKRAIPYLNIALGDPNTVVQETAKLALEKLSNKN